MSCVELFSYPTERLQASFDYYISSQKASNKFNLSPN